MALFKYPVDCMRESILGLGGYMTINKELKKCR